MSAQSQLFECTRCHKTLPPTEYGLFKKGAAKGTRNSRCNACIKGRQGYDQKVKEESKEELPTQLLGDFLASLSDKCGVFDVRARVDVGEEVVREEETPESAAKRGADALAKAIYDRTGYRWM